MLAQADKLDITKLRQFVAGFLASPKVKLLYWALIFLLCSWWGVKLVWMLVSPPSFNDQPLKIEAVAGARPVWNWFSASNVQKVEKIQQSKINAELVGVMIVGNKSVASISTPKKKKGVYVVGDKLQSGVTIDSIEEDRVILDENGRRREIKLKTLFEKGITADAPINDGFVSRAEAQGSTDDMMSLAPVILSDNSTGIKLKSAHADLLAMGDMREGDVIVMVGSVAVSELMNNPVKLQALMAQTSVPIQIERDGQRQEIYVNVAALAEKLMPQLGGSLF